MYAYTKPEAEAENTTDGADDRVAMVQRAIEAQQRAIEAISAAVFELGNNQMRMRDNLVALTTRCSELTGAVTMGGAK